MSRIRQQKVISKIIFAILGLLVFVFSYQLGNRYAQPEKQDTRAFLLPEPILLQPFSLIDEEGAAFNSTNFRDYWTLVILGDHQLEPCKQLMRRYVMVWNRLAHDKPLQNMTRVAFLSLNPTTNNSTTSTTSTTNELKSFVEFMHPDFVGLTGPQDDLIPFAAQLGLTTSASKPVQCNELDSIVALINPDSQLTALFTGISDPAIIAHDLEAISQK